MMKKLLAVTILMICVPVACANFTGNRSSESGVIKAYENFFEKEKAKETVNQLFVSTDNRNWEKAKFLFADEVLFDMTSMVGGDPVKLTPEEITASWDKGLKPLKAIHHQTGNYIVRVNQNEAEVFCYGIAYHYLPNKTNQNTRIFVGSYNFHLIREGEDWQIDKFKFNLKFIEGNPELEASR
jgi:hypothetical protein